MEDKLTMLVTESLKRLRHSNSATNAADMEFAWKVGNNFMDSDNNIRYSVCGGWTCADMHSSDSLECQQVLVNACMHV